MRSATPDLAFQRWGIAKCGGKGGKPGPCPGEGEGGGAPLPNGGGTAPADKYSHLGKRDAAFLRNADAIDAHTASFDSNEGGAGGGSIKPANPNHPGGFVADIKKRVGMNQSETSHAGLHYHNAATAIMDKFQVSEEQVKAFLDSNHGGYVAQKMVTPAGGVKSKNLPADLGVRLKGFLELHARNSAARAKKKK